MVRKGKTNRVTVCRSKEARTNNKIKKRSCRELKLSSDSAIPSTKRTQACAAFKSTAHFFELLLVHSFYSVFALIFYNRIHGLNSRKIQISISLQQQLYIKPVHNNRQPSTSIQVKKQANKCKLPRSLLAETSESQSPSGTWDGVEPLDQTPSHTQTH